MALSLIYNVKTPGAFNEVPGASRTLEEVSFSMTSLYPGLPGVTHRLSMAWATPPPSRWSSRNLTAVKVNGNRCQATAPPRPPDTRMRFVRFRVGPLVRGFSG